MIWLPSKDPAAGPAGAGRRQAGSCSSPGPRAGPRDLTVPTQSPCHLFFNALYNFGFQPSYMLGFHWLFTPFLRRSARCSTCAQGEVTIPTFRDKPWLIENFKREGNRMTIAAWPGTSTTPPKRKKKQVAPTGRSPRINHRGGTKDPEESLRCSGALWHPVIQVLGSVVHDQCHDSPLPKSARWPKWGGHIWEMSRLRPRLPPEPMAQGDCPPAAQITHCMIR